MPRKGKRNDLTAFVQTAKEKKLSKIDLIETCTTVYARYSKFCHEVLDLYHPPTTILEDLQSLNTWIYGPAGCGKSRLAREEIAARGDAYYLKSLNKWWDA